MKAPFLILGERRKARSLRFYILIISGTYEESKLSQGMFVEERSEKWRQSVSINVKRYRLKTYIGI
jgi:hypothetical protein